MEELLLDLPPQTSATQIAVFSDTHGHAKRFEQALALAAALPGGLAAAIHLGDYARDEALIARAWPDLPRFVVRGNNDFERGSWPDEIVLSVGSARIYASHGHQYAFTSRLSRLCYRAEELCAHMALFGHTHAVQYSLDFGVPIVNPGSVSIPRDGCGGSFAVLQIVQKMDAAPVVTATFHRIASANRLRRGV